jgi:hypothetical protein
MLTVEDGLEKLKKICDKPRTIGTITYQIKDTWDLQFINDVVRRVFDNSAISTSQGDVVMRLIARYKPHLIAVGLVENDIDILIAAPKYRRPPYQSEPLAREVRWAGNNKLVFRCKYSQNIVSDLKKCGSTNHFVERYPMFDRDHKLWIVDVNSGNWKTVMNLIKRHKFAFDDTVTQYFMEVSNAEGQDSEATVVDDKIKVTVKDDDMLDNWLNCIKVLDS